MKAKVEICAINLESAIAAQEGGAHRIELCDNIVEGGTTPSAATIKLAKDYLDIPVNVLIRPRGGDFLYSDLEYQTICEDVRFCKEEGINGVVIGLLKADGSVDTERTKALVDLAKPMEVTFHRAFDVCKDPFKALEDIIACGVDRILTSGLEPSAFEGMPVIDDLVKQSKGRISIMPGCGVNAQNVDEIIEKTAVNEVHLSAKAKVPSKMEYQSTKLSMSGGDYAKEAYYYASEVSEIKNIVKQLNS